MDEDQKRDLQQIRAFYDDVYFRGLNAGARLLRLLQRLAAWLGMMAGQQIFYATCGEEQRLLVETRWKDLYVLLSRWISSARCYGVPLRFAQAIILAVSTLPWQYQFYPLCSPQSAADT